MLAGIAAALVAPAVSAQSIDGKDGLPGIYVGDAGGHDVQPHDIGSTILFDRNLSGGFGSTVTTATGANAFGGRSAAFAAGGTDFRRSDDKFRWHSMRATAAFRF